MSQHEDPDRPTWGVPGERPGAPRAEDQLAEQGVKKRRPPASVTANAVSSWVDQQIQQAERQGAFDALPGAGRPLRDVDTRSDPDWWVRGLVEREQLDLSAAMPGPMQLRREKAGFPESLLDLPDEAAVRDRLEDFNERVLADRRRPVAGAASPPVVGRVDVEEMVAAWRQLREDRWEVEDGTRAGARAEASSRNRSTTGADRPLTASQRDRLPPEPDRGWWSRVLALFGGAADATQAGIITHRHQGRPDRIPRTRKHTHRGAGGIGNGP